MLATNVNKTSVVLPTILSLCDFRFKVAILKDLFAYEWTSNYLNQLLVQFSQRTFWIGSILV